jgi:hypothetical protein
VAVDSDVPFPSSSAAIDTTMPVSARIWSYWLGGKDYYPVATMLMGVLAHIGNPEEDDDRVAQSIVGTLKAALPSGGSSSGAPTILRSARPRT